MKAAETLSFIHSFKSDHTLKLFVCVCVFVAGFVQPDSSGPAGQPAAVSAGGAAVAAFAQHAQRLPQLRGPRADLRPRRGLSHAAAAQPVLQQDRSVSPGAEPRRGAAGGALHGGVTSLWQIHSMCLQLHVSRDSYIPSYVE